MSGMRGILALTFVAAVLTGASVSTPSMCPDVSAAPGQSAMTPADARGWAEICKALPWLPGCPKGYVTMGG